jgi:Major Facilitator Superfamily
MSFCTCATGCARAPRSAERRRLRLAGLIDDRYLGEHVLAMATETAAERGGDPKPPAASATRAAPQAPVREPSLLRPPAGPVGRLAMAALVTTVGNGLWYASWAIMLTRTVGLSADQVALGITLGGLAGLTAGVPVGRLADRFGTKPVMVVASLARAAGMGGYVFVHHFGAFLVVAVLATMADRSSAGVQVALVTSMTEGAERMSVLSYLRVVNSVGFAAGAGLAALALEVHGRWVFVLIVLFNAVTFLIYAVIVATLRGVRRIPAERAPGRGSYVVLRDYPYVLVTVLTGVLALCWGMLSTGVPLWITHHTGAPTWTAAVIIVVNSVVIALFQQRLSRGNDEPGKATGSARRAGIALALACVAFAAADHQSGGTVVVILLCACLIHVLGEMLYVAASWGLSIGLMPARDHGQYQGMSATGMAAAQSLAPALMTVLVVDWGVPGWFTLAALLLTAGLAVAPATRWALRSGPERTELPQPASHSASA